MQKDQDMTEFFVKAMYEWFWGTDTLAEYFIDIAVTTLNVNRMYYTEVVLKMN